MKLHDIYMYTCIHLLYAIDQCYNMYMYNVYMYMYMYIVYILYIVYMCACYSQLLLISVNFFSLL